jgi:hypothetical protein
MNKEFIRKSLGISPIKYAFPFGLAISNRGFSLEENVGNVTIIA